MSRYFTIIGTGSGQPEDLTRQARDAMACAGLLLSTDRLAENLSGLGNIETCPTGKLQSGRSLRTYSASDSGFGRRRIFQCSKDAFGQACCLRRS